MSIDKIKNIGDVIKNLRRIFRNSAKMPEFSRSFTPWKNRRVSASCLQTVCWREISEGKAWGNVREWHEMKVAEASYHFGYIAIKNKITEKF